MKIHKNILAAILTFASLAVYAGTPCEQIAKEVDESGKTSLSTSIKQQIQAREIEILNEFQLDQWKVIFVDPLKSDEVFLFYKDDPTKSGYVSLWSGVAKSPKRNEIERWALNNNPGIPAKLASCFAWFATEGIDAEE